MYIITGFLFLFFLVASTQPFAEAETSSVIWVRYSSAMGYDTQVTINNNYYTALPGAVLSYYNDAGYTITAYKVHFPLYSWLLVKQPSSLQRV